MTENKWIEDQYGSLIGKKVRDVVCEKGSCFYGLLFDDGTIAWISCDEEMNAPGFLEIQPPKAEGA